MQTHPESSLVMGPVGAQLIIWLYEIRERRRAADLRFLIRLHRLVLQRELDAQLRELERPPSPWHEPVSPWHQEAIGGGW